MVVNTQYKELKMCRVTLYKGDCMYFIVYTSDNMIIDKSSGPSLSFFKKYLNVIKEEFSLSQSMHYICQRERSLPLKFWSGDIIQDMNSEIFYTVICFH